MNETNHPARRLRHGERPTEPLVFDDAAANKAAEEGGLPERISQLIFDNTSLGWDKASNLATAVLVFVEADRASRQVANKAEVEPSDSYKAGYADGMDEGAKLAFWGDKPSEKFPEGWPSEIWLNAGDDELGPFSEYDELSWCSAPQGESDVRYIREDLLATPPATTGASTVDLRNDEVFDELLGDYGDSFGKLTGNIDPEPIYQYIEQAYAKVGASTAARPTDDELWDATLRDRDAYHEWADKLADAIAKHFGVDIGEHSNQNLPWAEALEAIENAEPVGASTVLTDERIAALYAPIQREVAAQAGQVAVPGWISVDEQLPSSDLLPNGDCPSVIGLWKEGALASNLVQQMITNTAYLRNNPQNFTHWMPLPASPAKESE